MDKTIQKIVELSSMPCSIVIVGVGAADFGESIVFVFKQTIINVRPRARCNGKVGWRRRCVERQSGQQSAARRGAIRAVPLVCQSTHSTLGGRHAT